MDRAEQVKLIADLQEHLEEVQSLVDRVEKEIIGGVLPVDDFPEGEGEYGRPFCAVIVGHSVRDGGAVNEATGVSEYDFNKTIAHEIADRCIFPCRVVYRGKYEALPSMINEMNPVFAVELHANGSENPSATGTEMVYWHMSGHSAVFASYLAQRVDEALVLGLRHGNGLVARDSGRGALLLRGTKMPCVIAEPFFITSDGDFARARERRDELINAYAHAIWQFAGYLGHI